MRRLNVSLDLKHNLWSYLVLYLAKWKYWNVPCRGNEILAYILLSLRNKKVELVLWFKTWYVNVLCFVFVKMNVLECSLSRKRYFSLHGKFYKWKGWMCPLIWEPIWFWIRKIKSIGMTLVAKIRLTPIWLQVW